ncbi:MAG: hypothetical protein ABI875_09470, partial [Gemmatimonadales bacterium]
YRAEAPHPATQIAEIEIKVRRTIARQVILLAISANLLGARFAKGHSESYGAMDRRPVANAQIRV